MPKAKTRKKGKTPGGATRATHSTLPANATASSVPANATNGQHPTRTSGKRPQSLLMTTMVALGCWGLAISFIFFTTDPNRYLWGGMLSLMALMWSVSLGLRLRKQGFFTRNN